MYCTAFVIVRTNSAASLRMVLSRLQDEDHSTHVRLTVVTLGTCPTEKIAAAAQVKDKVHVDQCLELSVRRPFREHGVEIPPRKGHEA